MDAGPAVLVAGPPLVPVDVDVGLPLDPLPERVELDPVFEVVEGDEEEDETDADRVLEVVDVDAKPVEDEDGL